MRVCVTQPVRLVAIYSPFNWFQKMHVISFEQNATFSVRFCLFSFSLFEIAVVAPKAIANLYIAFTININLVLYRRVSFFLTQNYYHVHFQCKGTTETHICNLRLKYVLLAILPKQIKVIYKWFWCRCLEFVFYFVYIACSWSQQKPAAAAHVCQSIAGIEICTQ